MKEINKTQVKRKKYNVKSISESVLCACFDFSNTQGLQKC
jgi:hypothetical protein